MEDRKKDFADDRKKDFAVWQEGKKLAKLEMENEKTANFYHCCF